MRILYPVIISERAKHCLGYCPTYDITIEGDSYAETLEMLKSAIYSDSRSEIKLNTRVIINDKDRDKKLSDFVSSNKDVGSKDTISIVKIYVSPFNDNTIHHTEFFTRFEKRIKEKTKKELSLPSSSFSVGDKVVLAKQSEPFSIEDTAIIFGKGKEGYRWSIGRLNGNVYYCNDEDIKHYIEDVY